MAISYVGVFTVTGNAAAVTVTWPAHQAGDLAILGIETSGNQSVPSTPTGFSVVSGSPVADVATTAGSNLHLYYRFATSASEASVSTGDSGDHQVAGMVVLRGVDQTTPFDATPVWTTKTTASTSVTYPSITTATADAWIVLFATRANDSGSATFSVPTNANLASITERGDGGTLGGNGGGLNIVTATKASAGSTGTSSGSTGSVSTTNVTVTLAIRPQAAVTHDTSGTPTGQGSTIVGSAARVVSHDTSGALSGQIGSVAGSAARFRAFPTSGALTGQGAAVAGSAARTREHPTSGALAGQSAALAGSAVRLRVMSTSGTLVGPGSEVAGSAARVGAPVTHAADGILVGPGSSVSGSAARSRAFSTTGSLIGQSAQIAGSAARTRLHATSGVLAGAGSVIDGSAARSAAIVTHATSGQLIGAGAVLAGSADRTGSAPPSVGDFTHLRRRRRI